MYPYLRYGLEMARVRRAPPLPIDGVHVSHHRCWPGDIDPWGELNNGRTLTLFDLGRVALAERTGVYPALRTNGWGLTVAGSSVRYRRRVTPLRRFEMRSAFVGRDPRFLYVHQAMFALDGEALNAVLIRFAVIGPGGMVPSDRVMAAVGRPDWPVGAPAWVEAWARADAERPWPPVFATEVG